MSYEKVKSIKIDEKNGKVFITCACNNSRPLSYDRQEFPYFSNLLKEQGKEGVEIALLKSYEEGTLQQTGTDNKYSKAKKVLYYALREEYFKFNWRNHNAKYGSEESKKERELRDSKEFKDLLLKALNYKIPKDRFIIYKENHGEMVFGKICPTCIKWSYKKENATRFLFEKEAEDNIYQSLKDTCKVEKITIKNKILDELED